VTHREDALVLALDQGSHASRAVLFDAAGEIVAEARQSVGTHREGEDIVEQDPVELVESLRIAADDACDSSKVRGRSIVAAGLATQRSTIVCWQRGSGAPLSHAISWQDRRATAWLAGFTPQANVVRGITGLPLSPHYGVSKLRWCFDHLQEVQRAAAAGELAAGPLSSFLVARLVAGSPCVVDPANASRTLLFDPATLDWSESLLNLFAIDRAYLPACVPTRRNYGRLSMGPPALTLAACTGDQSAAAFAFGRPDSSTALVNVGTGAFVQRVAPDGASLPAGLLRSVLYADHAGAMHAHEGTVNGAASALDWLRDRVAIDVDRGVAALAGSSDGIGEPPLFMNGVGGLGAPFWKPAFPVEFLGDDHCNDLARLASVLESIAFLLGVNIAALRASAPLTRIRLTGGLARSDYLCRRLADASGLPVERCAVAEATARGIAFIAAGEPADWNMVPVERVFTPAAEAAFNARCARWQKEMARRGAVA
jgi:glycerol kinase